MSGSSNGVSFGGTSNYGLLGALMAAGATTRQQEAILAQQEATGLVSSSYAGLGGGARTSLDIRPQLGHQQALIDGISAADGTIDVTQTALSQISSVASSFYAQVNSLDSADPTAVTTLAASARAALQEVAGLLNTTDGNSYVFAGTDSSNPPVPAADDILNSSFYTQISAAVGNLGTAGAAATSAATLGIAASNAPGTSPFSAALSQPSATLASQRNEVQIANGVRLPYGVLASANTEITSTGSTTGSYMRDLMRSLATLGSLTGAQAGGPGISSLVADTSTSLNNTVGAISTEQGVLGNLQSRIDTQSTTLSQTKTALTNQLSSVEQVDLATVYTNLTQVQTQLQAAYKMIAGANSLSLVNYI
jgi:flagellar hook-associated protein 3 FlgL